MLRSKAAAWLAKDPDPTTRRQLQELLDSEDESSSSSRSSAALQQAFATRLAFGTAGLRGLMGVGPNNMNRLVVQETTAGLADFVREAKLEPGPRQRVVVAYDGRHGSRAFAHDAAGVLAAKDIDVLLYETTAPTPLCAFAVKELGTAAGIVVTASHNPPEYNGYKVYRQGGTQINDPVDGQISDKIGTVAEQSVAPVCMPIEEAKAAGKIQMLGQPMFERYVATVLDGVSLAAGSHPLVDAAERARFPIAYTPLHGVGAPIAEELFRQLGFSSFHTVSEQREPNGDFPTVAFPNPEEAGATDLLIALADRHNAQIAVANDPDADRLCICARDRKGKMRQMTGDQLGALLGDALIRHALDVDGEQPDNLAVRCTIVSSRILARIAKSRGVEHKETLTGFKWLGPSAQQVTQSGRRFVFAYEEALGYMVSDVVLDKDGLSGLVAITELAYKLHRQGKTLWDQLEDIHRRVGLSITMQRTIKLQPGTSGDAIMKKLRAEQRKEIGKYTITLIDDLLEQPFPTSQQKGDELPKNDVLRYYFGDGQHEALSRHDIMLSQPRIIVRPSGTEPKVKIYCEILSDIVEGETYEEASQRATKELTGIVDVFHSWMSPPSKKDSLSSSSEKRTSHAQGRDAFVSPASWFRRLFRAFPLVTNDASPAQSPISHSLPSKPILYVAPAHPTSSSKPQTSQKWASSDPICLYWQTQLALRRIDFDSIHIEEDYTSPDYQGEGFSRVPMLLDVDGTVVGFKDLYRWADVIAPWPEHSRTLAESVQGRAFESLLQGPLLAGVLLELVLLPAPQDKTYADKPIFVRHLLRSLDAGHKRELLSHIAALVEYSPTSTLPGWVTSLHGLLGTGSASLTGTGSLASSVDDEDAGHGASLHSVDISSLDHDGMRREACLAIDAIATLNKDGKGWLLGESPTALDAHLFAELHTLLSLPVEMDKGKNASQGTLSPRLHLELAAPHLVAWTRNMWRNVAKPRGG